MYQQLFQDGEYFGETGVGFRSDVRAQGSARGTDSHIHAFTFRLGTVQAGWITSDPLGLEITLYLPVSPTHQQTAGDDFQHLHVLRGHTFL